MQQVRGTGRARLCGAGQARVGLHLLPCSHRVVLKAMVDENKNQEKQNTRPAAEATIVCLVAGRPPTMDPRCGVLVRMQRQGGRANDAVAYSRLVGRGP